VQRQLVPRDGLLLLYHIGHERSYVFAVPPHGQEAETFPLQVTEEQAALLEVAAGPMTTTLLRESLGLEASGVGAGLLKLLATRSPNATLAERLHALWRVLVPPALWTTLAGASEVVIVPDALLHYLPFEALVVQPGAEEAVQYWLDVGPVIRYAPSATALYNIDRRPAPRARPQADEATVLSVSDPIFSPAEVTATLAAGSVQVRSEGEENAASLATRDSYERAGGSLVRLPGTARETEAIQAAYGDEAGAAVLALQGLDASESNLRAVLTGKRYLHGLVDEQRGALFASLAVTPPAGENAALENDGFLQLHEIYDLNLSEAEMAVLSACESNIGPNIAGEGVFALSRGFFAAGARRVVASQWSVDDASTAALMGAFFERVVAAERSGRRVDFARALWEARQQVRADARWIAPYFWAPFVLTGKQ
jgi:hypothetical protein